MNNKSLIIISLIFLPVLIGIVIFASKSDLPEKNDGTVTFNLAKESNSSKRVNLYDSIDEPISDDGYIVSGEIGALQIEIDAGNNAKGIEYEIDFEGINIPEGMNFYLDKYFVRHYELESGFSGYIDESTEDRKKTYVIVWNWKDEESNKNRMVDDVFIDIKVVAKETNGYTMMENGFLKSIGMWSKEYASLVKTITFSNDLSILPDECNQFNKCFDISVDNSKYPVYNYLVKNGNYYDAYIISMEEIYAPNNSTYLFCLKGYEKNSRIIFSSLESINFNNMFNTSKVRIMNSMFRFTKVTNLDLSHFDTSKVVDMAYMFSCCSNLIKIDLSNFDTSKVINMEGMFSASSNIQTIINITNPNVENYKYIFEDAAYREDAKIVVNYNEQTLDLVNKMIKTKSKLSNIVMGKKISL